MKLEEFNEFRYKDYIFDVTDVQEFDLECPKCGQNLKDINPETLLLSWPPKIKVCCESCNYIGYRVA